MSLYQYHTLSNGLQLIYRRLPGAAAAYMGATVRCGSRQDPDGRFGLAHFVEHTLFKGTERRSSWHIINRMEAVGGELNAFTTKEETTVYTAFPAGQLRRAADLVADLMMNSRFPARELDKEREVVADEIDSYRDQPAEAVYDDFDDLLFAGSGLGHNILGTRSDLDAMTGDDCLRWLQSYFTADRTVLFYSGPSTFDRVCKLFEDCFGALRPKGEPLEMYTLCANPRFDIEREHGSHQAHTVIGARIGGMYCPERFTNSLLANMLGGPGMNSLLNVALRERRGLVYTVDASTAFYTDCGLVSIYYGCDPEDNRRCRRLVETEIARIADGSLNPRRIEAAKKQYLGQMLIAGENRENSILGAARATLFHGRAADRAEIAERINDITPERMAAAAARLLQASRLTLV